MKFAKRLSNLKSLPLLYFLLAFIGNQVDNMWGCLAFATPVVYGGIFGLQVETVCFLFIVSPLVYPAIRILQAIIASVIATPIMKTVTGTPWVFQEKNMLSP